MAKKLTKKQRRARSRKSALQYLLKHDKYGNVMATREEIMAARKRAAEIHP
jgi:hypothetical protein